MFRFGLALCLLVAMSPSGQCGTLKKKRDSGHVMATDYIADDAGYEYDYGETEVVAFYDVKYDKKFHGEWLNPNSGAFAKEARKVKNALQREIAQEFNIVAADVGIEVDNFIPGSTRAQVRITIPEYYGISVDGITTKMNSLVENNFRIGRAAVLEVADLNTPTAGGTATGIIFELTYENDIRTQAAALNDTRSRDFEVLSNRIASQVELLLVEPLQRISGLVVSPDTMDTKVLKISPDGIYTKAGIELHVDGVPIEAVSGALLALTDPDNADIRIDGGLIIGLDELDRVFRDDADLGSVTAYDPEDYVPYDLPDYEEMVKVEVMGPKNEPTTQLNDQPRNEGGEPTPPPLEASTESSTTSIPPQTIKKAAPNEPTPPGNCYPDGASKPRYGSVSCTFANEIGSTCHFTCDPDTQMVGTDTIACGWDGRWNEDPPYCIRLRCQPPVNRIGNGTYECTNANHLKSNCSFSCDPGFTMTGEKTITCQRSEEWSSNQPTCDMNPVNCEEEYGEWSECVGGTRKRAEVTVTRGSFSIVCPALSEDCTDCELEWGDWSKCVEGVRSRSEYIKQQRIGSGRECNTPNVERQECVQCEVAWGDWGICTSESRSRSQVVTVEPVGYECPELLSETQDCLSCVVEMGDWGNCEEGITLRRQEIVREPTNGGQPCPEKLQKEEKACQNCEVEWTEWNKCLNGRANRSTVVTVQPSGAGEKCPEPQTEEAACQDCVVEWSDWSACTDGKAERHQVITQQQVGQGEVCPELETETEACADCKAQWGDWGPCLSGLSIRRKFVIVPKSGVGAECSRLDEQFRDCAQCLLEWGPWNECDGNSRTRTQRIIQRPVNEEPCPEIQQDIEPCADCSYEWTDWGECDFGTATRSLTVLSEPTGAGKACPTNATETKDCCFFVWQAWGQCTDGLRTRVEELISQPTGEVCRDVGFETEECSDCVLGWGEWSECSNGIVVRSQVVITPGNGGKPCPLLGENINDCSNCVLDWEPWGECVSGGRTRQQIIAVESSGLGKACPELLQVESEDCYHCESQWSEWSECRNGQRIRNLEILQEQVGAGDECPSQRTQSEACVDCVMEWTGWSPCVAGDRTRTKIIRTQPVGAGEACEDETVEVEECADCAVEWGPWSNCSINQRQRQQVIRVQQVGAGRSCPSLQTEFETCIDCVVEWGPWNDCFAGTQIRRQVITTTPEGVGKACPRLLSDERACEGSPAHFEKLVCRFVDTMLGYKSKPIMRDLLLIADESGSIGRINFEKIKDNFKSIAKNIRGGVGSQETQIAMSSFARLGRTLFDFDDHPSAEEVISAIDKSYYKGGYRSRIGEALRSADQWLFQQTSGMRSFPNIDDNIVHEILIATDGCRTRDIYHLKQGLDTIKRRGIKLYVLGIATKDARCRKTIDAMIEDQDNLFMLGSWAELDELNQRVDEGVCLTAKGDIKPTTTQTTPVSEGEGDDGSGAPLTGSRGDSAGEFRARFRRDTASNYKLGSLEE